MRVMISDADPLVRFLAGKLAAAGHEVRDRNERSAERPEAVLTAISHRGDVGRLGAIGHDVPGVPMLVLTRVAFPEVAKVEDLDITLMFPGFSKGSPGYGAQSRLSPLGLPATAVGPLTGRPRPVQRRLIELFRSAGVRALCREAMQEWLTVTSAWMGPLRGAIVAAARQGLSLGAAPDLVTVTARAARERLRLLRVAGYHVDPGSFCLLALPESWAIATVAEIARVMAGASDLLSIPTVEEAITIGERLKVLACEQGARTPAADFLDGFSLEETGRENERTSAASRQTEDSTELSRC